MHAGGGFLGAADDGLDQIGMPVVDREDQVGSVVERQGWLHLQGLVDAPVEFLGIHVVPGVDADAALGQGRGQLVETSAPFRPLGQTFGPCGHVRPGAFFYHDIHSRVVAPSDRR